MSQQHRNGFPSNDLRSQPITVGRYILHRQIARGGMATIHIARLMGDEGFSRIVAAKRLHPEFAEDEEFVAMFLDEARIASKVRHRNVVPVLDVVTAGEEVILVQEYVHGVPLQWLLRTMHQSKAHVPLHIAVAIACQVLAGLHAAHEAVDELGTPLQIVHRDVSPQNVLVAVDGSAKLLDFGVAKATMAAHITREGTYKGKVAYSAPEQLRGAATRQSDVYSLSVLLWELMVGHRLHRTVQSGAELVATVMMGALPTIIEALAAERDAGSISDAEWHQIEVIDPIVRKGLAVDMRERWASAAEMEEALVAAVRPAAPSVVAAWLKTIGKDFLEGRDWLIASEEASWRKLTGGPHGAVGSGPRTSAIHFRVRPEDIDDDDGEPATSARTRRRPPAPTGLVIALVVALATCFALIIVILSRGDVPEQRAPAALPPTPPPEPEPSPAESVVPTATVEPDDLGDMLAPEVLATDEVEDLLPVESATRLNAKPAPASRARLDNRGRPAVPRAAPPSPLSAPASPAAGAPNCNPPYYFEGSKKIFKAACL